MSILTLAHHTTTFKNLQHLKKGDLNFKKWFFYQKKFPRQKKFFFTKCLCSDIHPCAVYIIIMTILEYRNNKAKNFFLRKSHFYLTSCFYYANGDRKFFFSTYASKASSMRCLFQEEQLFILFDWRLFRMYMSCWVLRSLDFLAMSLLDQVQSGRKLKPFWWRIEWLTFWVSFCIKLDLIQTFLIVFNKCKFYIKKIIEEKNFLQKVKEIL